MPRFDTRLIRSTGPCDSPLWCIGEAPGQEEHHRGYSFCGKSGQILDLHLAWHGHPRHKTFVWNLVHYWPGEGNPDPDAHDIARDSPRLAALIAKHRPKVIAAIGRISASWLLDRPVTMERDHGLTFWSPRVNAIVVPCYHPAAGFHRAPDAEKGWSDLRVACQAVERRPPLVVNTATPIPDTVKVVVERGGRRTFTKPLVVDTEGLEGSLWGLSYCPLGSDRVTIVRYPDTKRLKLDAPSYIFHYAPHDLRILALLGVTGRRGAAIHDTMSRAYVLQTEPQALKNLAYRHLNIDTPDFDTVVEPYYLEALEDWVHLARTAPIAWPKPKRTLVFDAEKDRYHFSKPHTIPTRLKTLHNTILRSTADMRTLEKRISEWDALAIVAKAVGPPPTVSLHLVPDDIATRYAGGDAWLTSKLWPILEKQCVAAEVEPAYRMDAAILMTIRRIERNGILLDRGALAAVGRDFAKLLNDRLRSLQSLVGDPNFNPGSAPQVKDYLYNRLKLWTRRRSKKTGAPSSDERALQTLRASLLSRGANNHPALRFITDLLDYRGFQKFIGTYIDNLLAMSAAQSDGRVRCRIKYTRTYTGRFASEDLLLTLPKRSDEGKRIREAFIAKPGYTLLSVDLSQIELRIMAHASGDRKMVAAIQSGADLHTQTAVGIFGTAEGSARDAGKTLNFAIMYGIGPESLYDQLRLVGVKTSPYDPSRELSIDDCRRMISAWFDLYPGVRRYMSEQSAKSRRFGAVRTSSGRQRILPYARWDANPAAQAESDRQSGNHRIQGDANEYIKRVMARLESSGQLDQWEDVGDAYLALQVHDELLFEVKESALLGVARVVYNYMIGEQTYRVPIEAEAKHGRRWGGMEKIDMKKVA